MYPTLFTIGPVSVSTSVIISIIGFLLSGFVFWRRGKEEHYSESQLFDGFLLSFFVGLVSARAFYIIFSFEKFGWSLLNWFNLINYPGGADAFFLIGSTIFMARFASKQKWNVFEILDFWSIALVVWLFFRNIADFLSGVGRGNFTQSPIGLIFPGSIEKAHPAQLYLAIFLLLIYWYLAWSEIRYRTFNWYRLGRKAAQTGFLFSTFIIFYSLLNLFILLIRQPSLFMAGTNWDAWLYSLGLFYGAWLLLRRADKPLIPISFQKRNDPKKKQEFVAAFQTGGVAKDQDKKEEKAKSPEKQSTWRVKQ